MLLLSGASKEALKSGLSDMEYLRSKVAQTDDTMEENEPKDDGAGGDDEDNGPVQHTDSAYESGDTSKTNTSVSSEDKKHSKAKKTAKQEVTVQTNLRVKHYYSIHPSICYQFVVLYDPHLFVADGAGDGVHGEAERSPVQCERGE